jgi:hypothetical protein
MSPGKDDKGLQDHQIHSKASTMLKKQIAENMDVVSVIVAQSNRKDAKPGETRRVENVGGSYKVGQDADDFMILNLKTADQRFQNANYIGNRSIFLDKRRGGSSDILFDIDVDDYKNFNLRVTECVSHEFLLGLSHGHAT